MERARAGARAEIIRAPRMEPLVDLRLAEGGLVAQVRASRARLVDLRHGEGVAELGIFEGLGSEERLDELRYVNRVRLLGRLLGRLVAQFLVGRRGGLLRARAHTDERSRDARTSGREQAWRGAHTAFLRISFVLRFCSKRARLTSFFSRFIFLFVRRSDKFSSRRYAQHCWASFFSSTAFLNTAASTRLREVTLPMFSFPSLSSNCVRCVARQMSISNHSLRAAALCIGVWRRRRWSAVATWQVGAGDATVRAMCTHRCDHRERQ